MGRVQRPSLSRFRWNSQDYRRISKKKNTLFAQGDVCKDVMYIQTGSVKLSVVSKTGKEAMVAILQPGDFVGEGALARQPVRLTTATAVTPTSVLVIGLQEMKRVLHEEHAFSDRFIHVGTQHEGRRRSGRSVVQ
jgi:CRP-like cAMP-binding protein